MRRKVHLQHSKMNFEMSENESDDDLCNENWQRPSEDVLEDFQGRDTQSSGMRGRVHGQSPLKTDSPSPTSKVGHSKHSRCIIHIDFDCFYAQVEMLRNPSLRNKPVAVYQKHSLVTSNYVARGLGVKKMSTKTEGLKACPELVLINGEDLTPYREYSAKMFALIKEFSPFVERVGLDENFIDVSAKIDEVLSSSQKISVKGHCYGFENTDMSLDTILSDEISKYCDCGCIRRLAAASLIASDLRSALYSRLGLTASAGIANNKVLAKLIGKTHKPNQQTTIFPAFAVKFLSEKKVREIPGVGSRTAKLLDEMGVSTVNDICNKSKQSLMERFGVKLGTFLKNISVGIDDTEVAKSENVLKSVSEEESFRKLTDYEEVKRQIEILVKKVLARIDEAKRVPKTIKLTLRKHFQEDNYSRESRQAPFNPRLLGIKDETERVQKIVSILLSLFDKMVDRSTGFDLAVINVCFTNFEEKSSSSTISKFFTNSNATTTAENIDRNMERKVAKKPKTEGINEETNTNEVRTSMFESKATVCETTFGKHSRHSVLSPEPKDHAREIEDSFQQQCSSSIETSFSKRKTPGSVQNRASPNNTLTFPDDISPDVFKELPSEIQQELVDSWRQGNKHKKESPSIQPKKKQKLNKNDEVKSKSILNYFSK